MLMSSHSAAPLPTSHKQQQQQSQVEFDIRLQHYLPSEVKSTSVKLEMLCKCSGWHLVAHRASQLSSATLDEYREQFGAQHDAAAATLASFDALLEFEAASRCAAEAIAARSRALACIAESDALRRQNNELRRRLAGAERQIDARVLRETSALKTHNEQLQQQLVQLKQEKQNNIVNKPSPTSSIAVSIAATQNNNNNNSVIVNMEPQFAPTQLTSQKQINQWMNEHSEQHFIFYRRNNNNNNNDKNDQNEAIALCVRTASNELVHSKIKRTSNGLYCCVREVCAATLGELVHSLQL